MKKPIISSIKNNSFIRNIYHFIFLINLQIINDKQPLVGEIRDTDFQTLIYIIYFIQPMLCNLILQNQEMQLNYKFLQIQIRNAQFYY